MTNSTNSRTEMQGKDRALINGQVVIIKKNAYTWLWEIRYENGMLWAGPYKTRKEARERLCEAVLP